MAEREHQPIVQSLQEYGRGIAGGLLFSLPLLYTMEVWWTGFLVSPTVLLIATGATFVLLLGYNRYGGMRPSTSLRDVVIDSVEEMGIGLVLAAVVLILLGQVTADMPHHEILGKIILEAMIVSVGVSVGTAQLGGEAARQNESEEDSHPTGKNNSSDQPHLMGQLVLAFCGATLFAANIAPTEEIVIVAIETSVWKLLGLVVVSILLGALVLHYSQFHGTERRMSRGGTVLKLLESVASYATALVASAMMLWLFQRFNDVSLITCVSETVVLGFVGNLGAAAGRLLIQ